MYIYVPLQNVFQLDMSGVSYGDCVCGHSRKDHLVKNKDTRLKVNGKYVASPLRHGTTAERKRETACRIYRLDVAAEDGECVCGHSRSAHKREGGKAAHRRPTAAAAAAKKGSISANVGQRLASVLPPSREELEFDAQMFNSTVNALDSVLIDDQERTAMFRVVAGKASPCRHCFCSYLSLVDLASLVLVLLSVRVQRMDESRVRP
jgi:hypothetical protein